MRVKYTESDTNPILEYSRDLLSDEDNIKLFVCIGTFNFQCILNNARNCPFSLVGQKG